MERGALIRAGIGALTAGSLGLAMGIHGIEHLRSVDNQEQHIFIDAGWNPSKGELFVSVLHRPHDSTVSVQMDTYIGPMYVSRATTVFSQEGSLASAERTFGLLYREGLLEGALP